MAARLQIITTLVQSFHVCYMSRRDRKARRELIYLFIISQVMVSKQQNFTKSVTTKDPRSVSSVPPMAISLEAIVFSHGMAVAGTKIMQMGSSSLSPTLTTSLPPNILATNINIQFAAVQDME